MTKEMALAVLAVLAMLPSLWRTYRPIPRPAVPHSTQYTSEADRLLFAEKMDLNHADREALELIPGIGPALAARIVERQPYASLDDVDRVEGIGPAKLKVLSRWATLRAATFRSGRSRAH